MVRFMRLETGVETRSKANRKNAPTWRRTAMARHILAILLTISTLAGAQTLPDAPKPKPTRPAQRLTFISIKDHKKAYIITGFAAAAITTTALVLANGGSHKKFQVECACPAKVPKK